MSASSESDHGQGVALTSTPVPSEFAVAVKIFLQIRRLYRGRRQSGPGKINSRRAVRLIACAQMPALRWKSLAAPAERQKYVALVTFLSLKRFRSIPRFMWFSLQVQQQLARSKGLVGYSLDSDIRRLRFWTLSAWADRKSITQFVHENPHARIMRSLVPLMEKTRFVYWQVGAGDIPLRWDDARARLD